MKKFFNFRVPGFNKVEMKVYHLSCAGCGYERMVELKNPDFEVAYTASGGVKSEFELVDEMPKHCPQCGRRLKKMRIPVPIYT
ncbi:MAG: hypothetical protein PHI85_01075 [Victivallaceae bacterium]|nr:hypothetical protein [Victivallaceae bacterium]